jgi:glycosyltransferase involved in cell wall biosynthesis
VAVHSYTSRRKTIPHYNLIKDGAGSSYVIFQALGCGELKFIFARENSMRIIAMLTSYNESRFIGHILEHYLRNGIEVFLLDNESTDDTVEIASQYLDKNLIEIRTIPRSGKKEWVKMLALKEDLAESLKADWFIHADPDEFRSSPDSETTLAQAIADVDKQGYNAVNFMEFSFVPTKDEPDHDHPRFLQTMKYYYPFLPRPLNRLNAWRQPPRSTNLLKSAWKTIRYRKFRQPVAELVFSGGHQVRFDGIRPFPDDFKMRHYIVLSLEHAYKKYVSVSFEEGKKSGDWRGGGDESFFHIPSAEELRLYQGEDSLDSSNPRTQHIFVAE